MVRIASFGWVSDESSYKSTLHRVSAHEFGRGLRHYPPGSQDLGLGICLGFSTV